MLTVIKSHSFLITYSLTNLMWDPCEKLCIVHTRSPIAMAMAQYSAQWLRKAHEARQAMSGV